MRNNTSTIYNLCLVVGDFLALVFAFTTAYVLRVSISHRVLSAPVPARTYLAISLTLLPFWILIFALLGLYNGRTHERRYSELGRLIIGSFIGVLFAISYAYIANVILFPARLVTVYDFGLAFFFVFIFRTIARSIRRELFSYNIGINNVLLVGDSRTTLLLLESLNPTPVTGYKVVGVVGGSKYPLPDAAPYHQYQDFEAAKQVLSDESVHTIIQTELYADGNKNNEILSYAQAHHISYRFAPGNSELFVGNLKVELFSSSLPIVTVHQTPLTGWGRVAKRLFDFVGSCLLLLVASPFMLIIALIIKLSDPGPVFFRHTRLTRFGNEVKVFKFRSMHWALCFDNNEDVVKAYERMGRPDLAKEFIENRAKVTGKDPRVSAVGNVLRKLSLDELPQLFNVLSGSISLVGPRAIPEQELAYFKDKGPLVLNVKTGITGLAQVSGRSNISLDERLRLDLYYVQNWSFGMDVMILLKTLRLVLFSKGAV